MKKMLLFDIDGTLLRAGQATTLALQKAFQDLFGLKDCEFNVSLQGRTDPCIIEDIAKSLLERPLNFAEYEELCQVYNEHLQETIYESEDFEVLPGVKVLLEHLSLLQSVIVGIETGNLEKSARIKLKRAELSQYFTFGAFSSDSRNRTEIVRLAIKRGKALAPDEDSIKKNNIYVIGDAIQDVKAGKANGTHTIAMLTRREDEKTLGTKSPDLVLNDFSKPSRFLDYIF